VQQTKLASSLVNFRAHYKIVGLYLTLAVVYSWDDLCNPGLAVNFCIPLCLRPFARI